MKDNPDQYSKKEAKARFEAAMKAPHKPLKDEPKR
jgi:hypothetical protein